MIACLSIASTAGVAAVTAAPAAASTSATVVELPAVPAADGVPFLMTATIEPDGTGSVPVSGTLTFDYNDTPIGSCVNITVTPVGSGSLDAEAQCDITFNATGSFAITAVYSGDANWTGSSVTTTENVLEPATVTASASPTTAVIGQSVQLSATVSGSFGTPTGSVEFQGANSTTLCTATLSGGTGHCSYAFPQDGTQAVTANYLGNAMYADSTGSASFGHATVVVGTPTSTATTTTASAQEVALSSNGVPPGLTAFAMNFTATVAVSGTPGPNLDGSVTFTLDGQPIAAAGCTDQTVSGPTPQSVTCSDTDPEQFGGPVVATFSTDPNYAGSASAPVAPAFSPDATSVSSVTSAPPAPIVGQSVVLSAQVNAYLAPDQGPHRHRDVHVGRRDPLRGERQRRVRRDVPDVGAAGRHEPGRGELPRPLRRLRPVVRPRRS